MTSYEEYTKELENKLKSLKIVENEIEELKKKPASFSRDNDLKAANAMKNMWEKKANDVRAKRERSKKHFIGDPLGLFDGIDMEKDG